MRDKKQKNVTVDGRVFSFDATSSLLATAGAIRAGAVHPHRAQLLGCELYDITDIKKKKKKKKKK